MIRKDSVQKWAVTSLWSLAFTLVGSVAVLVRPTESLAADADVASAKDSSLGLEEIVVTARRRAESLESVPVSATVVSGASLSNQGIQTLQDLSEVLPGIALAKGSTTDRQFVRGIGSGDNPSFEQSVGTFIDDIYHGRARYSEDSLFDVDRVEVLKGPQTTYFGNNAIAGALNVVTRDPGATPSSDVRASYTPRFDGYSAEAGVDLPTPSTLGIRLAGQANGGNGWIHDQATGDDVPRTRNAAGRATLVWIPNEEFTAKFKAQYVRDREEGGLPLVRQDCPPPAAFGAASGFCAAAIHSGAAPYSSDFSRNTSPGQLTDLDAQDYVASITFKQEHYAITSVTGFTRYSYNLDSDLDMTPANLLSIQAPEHYRQFSQEFRATGNAGPIEWIGGVYYQESLLNVSNLFDYGFLGPTIQGRPAFAPLVPYLPFGINNAFQESANTGSTFGALTYNATDRLSLTGAARYTVLEKNFQQAIGVGTATANFGPFVGFPASVAPLGAAFAKGAGLATAGNLALSRKDVQTSPSASVQYKLTDTAMLYARYDHGFKAGGFNGADLTGNAAELPFAPEKVNAYELGLKSRLWDDRMSVNLDVFRSDYSNLQLAGIVPTSTGAYVNRVQNAGGAVSQGVELDTDVRITRGLRSKLSIAYMDVYYTSYPNATPTALQTLDGAHTQDLSGQRTPFAPLFSGSWSLSYEMPLVAGWSGRIENRVFATGKYFLNFNNDPYDRQAGYARDDVTLSFSSDTHWEFDVIGQNVTDRVIRTYGAALPTSLGTYVFMTEPPANVTLQVKYAF
jgi:iron complex outermembrane receptor protein